MPGSKYDKFFCEEFTKKLKKVEDIEEINERVRSFGSEEEALDKFLVIVQSYE